MMKLQKQGWTFMAAAALVVSFASTALAIEAFQAQHKEEYADWEAAGGAKA